MNQQGRLLKIEDYGNSYDYLIAALVEFPKEMWKFKPSEKEWSIHEIIIHLADSEANSFVRCRRFIAEPGKIVMAYDQDIWAQRLNYHDQDVDEALELFRMLRLSSYKLIKDLPEEIWKNTIDHPENGIMTFDEWLDIYEKHVRVHIAQMERVFNKWKNSSM